MHWDVVDTAQNAVLEAILDVAGTLLEPGLGVALGRRCTAIGYSFQLGTVLDAALDVVETVQNAVLEAILDVAGTLLEAGLGVALGRC